MAARTNNELSKYYENLKQEVLEDANAGEDAVMRPAAFTRYVLDILIEAGELEDATTSHHKATGVEVHGFGADEDDTVNLIIARFSGVGDVAKVPKVEVATGFKRLMTFWNRATTKDYFADLEESSDAYDMAHWARQVGPKTRRLKLFYLTDGVTSHDRFATEKIDGLEVRRYVWDLDRLFQLESSGQPRESIEIDFISRFGRALPCIGAEAHSDDYEALLAVIPGAWLAEIYEEYGSRLLELNVRSFLQATGKVNRGIRDTLRDEPGRFLAYNNGISATASDIQFQDEGDVRAIAGIRNLQIVNGGQTTASVHRASITGVDLEKVAVQAKITIVDEKNLEQIVPLISRYANSQNKVSEADLTSNDPFHVELEELSRTTWTPVEGDGLAATKWFYERARGQYRDALSRAGTPAKRRDWQKGHPPRQKFTKTDLAKFSSAWDQRPHEVSRGAQKNFTLFMAELKKSHVSPTPQYFERLIATAILWKRAEKLIQDQGFGGYRANLVAYSIAKLAHASSQRVDLQQIWKSQSTDGVIDDAIIELAHVAWKIIVDDAPAGANIGEWAKKSECWDAMRAAKWEVTPSLEAILQPHSGLSDAAPTSGGGRRSSNPDVADCIALGAESWFDLAIWAKEVKALATWQTKSAHDIGSLLKRGTAPSSTKATQGKKILEEAKRLGFRP